jgi:hypothetical protein
MRNGNEQFAINAFCDATLRDQLARLVEKQCHFGPLAVLNSARLQVCFTCTRSSRLDALIPERFTRSRIDSGHDDCRLKKYKKSTGCGFWKAGDGHLAQGLFVRLTMSALRTWIAAGLVCISAGALAQAQGPIYYEDYGLLALPAVQVGTATYTDVKLLNIGNYTFRLLTATEQVPPAAADVSYDGATGILNIPAVAVGNTTYVNVTLLNFGSYTFSLQTASALASITVSSATLSPKEGDTVQLTAVARDPNGNMIPITTVTWSSSDTNIATIATTGLLQTLRTGTLVVTAAINGVSGSQSLTITPLLVSVTVGAKELVFAYSTDRCDDLDVPDLPPRMVRAEDGTLVLFAGDAPRFYVSRGADFNSFKRDCSQPALVSADRRTPESYENWEWISTVYREGNRWHALIHNEFHDAVASTCKPGDPSPGNPCWYNSVTHAVSTDGARTFTKPLAPAHVVAPPPYVWVPPLPGASPNAGYYFYEGYGAPQSIVRKGDGFFYAVVGLVPSKANPPTYETCWIRTDNLDDPASWRAWDGSGFNLPMTSPYVTGGPAPICKLSHDVPGANITFNTYLNRYMEVGNYRQTVDGKPFCGVYFSLSADLFHWSEQQLIAEIRDDGWCAYDPQNQGLLEPVPVMYTALFDHADTTINFERPGRTPYLYYVRFNEGNLDRDLVRVPLTFTRLD